jgi:myo-inositol-1(or 4)-monophosphatase
MKPSWLDDAVDIARRAGAILRKNYGHPGRVDYKGGIDLVTETDRQSEAFVRAEIARRFPGHAWLGEESGASLATGADAEFRWVVDPLDGTTNFAHGYPFFAVSIALEERGQRALGVVYDPLRDECFAAARGRGALLNGVPIAVSRVDRLDRALGATGFPYDVHERPEETLAAFGPFLSRLQGVRRDGSAALNLAYVACGRFDLFWETKLHAWDVAAAALVVEEAGGRTSDFAGGPMPADAFEVAASNGVLHPALLGVLAEVPRLPRPTAAGEAWRAP